MCLKRLVLGCTALALLTCLPARAVDDAQSAHLVQFANERFAATAARLDPTRSPEFTKPDGAWSTVANTDPYGWTQGFFPGANWYVFDLTGDLAANNNAKLIPHMSHKVELTGDVTEKGSTMTIAASSLKMISR